MALSCQPALAGITVFAPGIAVAPLRKLAEAWTAESGHKVTITGGNVGRIRAAVLGDAPADLVLAPPADLADLAIKLVPGSEKPVGRILFGLVVKAGGPHPDISTPEKFVNAMKAAGVLAFADPAVGSLSGAMVETMLKRPEFAGVEPRPIKGLIGDAIVRGDAVLGAGAVSEELMTAPNAEIVGPVPDKFGLHIDIDGAVLNVAARPDEAGAFRDYITAAKARAVWKAGGIEAQ